MIDFSLSENLFGCIEVQLKPTRKVIAFLKRFGYDWVELGKPKIVYMSKKVYSKEELERIFINNEHDLIKIQPFNFKQIKKLRPAITELLLGDDRIDVGLSMEEYISRSSTKTLRPQKISPKNYSVYVFELNNLALDNKTIRGGNEPIEGRFQKAYYVGQTSLSIEARFDVHTNPENPKHSKGSWVMKKFAASKEFNKCNVAEELTKKSNIKTNDLTYFESLDNERRLAYFIRDELNCYAHFG